MTNMTNDLGTGDKLGILRALRWPLVIVLLASGLSWAVFGLEWQSAALAFLIALLVVLPRLQILTIMDKPADQWLEAENKARQTLAQVIGGFILLAGAFSAWRQFENQREQLAEQRRQSQTQTALQQNQAAEQRRQFQLQLDEQQRQALARQRENDTQRRDVERQFRQQEKQLADQREQFRLQFEATRDENTAEQFRTTVQQLSSEVLETRLAALHSLEKISRRSNRDQWAILQIITAFVRRVSPSPGPLLEDDFAYIEQGRPKHKGLPVDVQRALEVITLNEWSPPSLQPEKLRDESEEEFQRRLNTYKRTYRVNLSGTDLRGAVISGLTLDAADFSGSCLMHAQFGRASLRGANFTDADLRFAFFAEAQLQDADLEHVNARNAAFPDANMKGANLSRSDFADAHLRGTSLQGARLYGARLIGNSLGPGQQSRIRENYRGALIDAQTNISESIRAFLEAENPANRPYKPVTKP